MEKEVSTDYKETIKLLKRIRGRGVRAPHYDTIEEFETAGGYTDADLDEGIKDMVFKIRDLGFKTVGSCQGGIDRKKHIRHCTKYPWVEISEKNSERVDELIKTLKAEGLPIQVRKEEPFLNAQYYRIAFSKEPIVGEGRWD